MKVFFSPHFLKKVERLEKTLQVEVAEKINLFRDEKNHRGLKVYKLHGPLATWYGFSVNYKIRIIFDYLGKDGAVLFAIGDHDIYK